MSACLINSSAVWKRAPPSLTPILALTNTSFPSSGKGACRLSSDALGDPHDDIRGFDIVDQANELVSADPGDGICLAYTVRQPTTDRDEELIRRLVAQAVVDALEVVYVDEKHADLRIRPSLPPCNRLAQTV